MLPKAQLSWMFGDVTAETVLNAGLELGLRVTAARRILAEVLNRVAAALKKESAAASARSASGTDCRSGLPVWHRFATP